MSEHVLPLAICADHPAYAGHFPGRPILPGVVLLDAALQALAVEQGVDAGQALAQLKSAKFHRPVTPGEALTLHYASTPNAGVRFEIRSGERSVASGSVAFSPRAPA